MKVIIEKNLVFQIVYPPIGGSKGAARDASSAPGIQILSISCSFWENLAKSYVGVPLEGWHPNLGEILDLPLPPTINFCFVCEKKKLPSENVMNFN